MIGDKKGTVDNMFQTLLIVLIAAAAGQGRGNPAESPRPEAKVRYDSVKQICEALPNIPDHALNDVALLVASEDADKWFQKNAVGSAVQVAGEVSHLQLAGQRPENRSSISVFQPRPGDGTALPSAHPTRPSSLPIP